MELIGRNGGAMGLEELTHGKTKAGRKLTQSGKVEFCAGDSATAAAARNAADGSSTGEKESTGCAVTSLLRSVNLASMEQRPL